MTISLTYYEHENKQIIIIFFNIKVIYATVVQYGTIFKSHREQIESVKIRL